MMNSQITPAAHRGFGSLWMALASMVVMGSGLSAAEEQWVAGRVVGVHDGDSLTLLVSGNRQLKVRLESIDTPELGQEFGNNAKRALSDLAFGKVVQVRVSGTDRYGRTLGWVFADQLNVNLEMVRTGFAWNYVEYSKSRKLVEAEASARERKVGLWQDWNPMAPWDWRALQKRNAAERAIEAERMNPLSGSTKQKAAALYWLNLSSNKRHNQSCRWYGSTKRGRACSADEGSACGICGG